MESEEMRPTKIILGVLAIATVFSGQAAVAQDTQTQADIVRAVLTAAREKTTAEEVIFLIERAGIRLHGDAREMSPRLDAGLLQELRRRSIRTQALDDLRTCPPGNITARCRFRDGIDAALMVGEINEVESGDYEVGVQIFERSPSERQPIDQYSYRVVLTRLPEAGWVAVHWELLQIT